MISVRSLGDNQEELNQEFQIHVIMANKHVTCNSICLPSLFYSTSVAVHYCTATHAAWKYLKASTEQRAINSAACWSWASLYWHTCRRCFQLMLHHRASKQACRRWWTRLGGGEKDGQMDAAPEQTNGGLGSSGPEADIAVTQKRTQPLDSVGLSRSIPSHRDSLSANKYDAWLAVIIVSVLSHNLKVQAVWQALNKDL